MKKVKDSILFGMIHDYFRIYLPKQRKSRPNTIRAYQAAIESLFDFVKNEKNIKLSEITFEMIDRKMIGVFLERLEIERSWSISTRNHRLQCIRAFYAYAADMDATLVKYRIEILKVPMAAVPKSSIVKYVSESVIKAIWEQPDVSKQKGLRDRFMMIMLYDSAARIQELLDIRLRDLQFGTPSTVVLHGKAGKIRVIPLLEKTVKFLREYIEVFHPEANRRQDDYLFYVARKGHRKRMCEDNARKFIQAYGRSARMAYPEVPEDIHPHLFRHSRAMHLYRQGMPLPLLSEWLGHAQLETTLIYAHADTELKRKAIESATPPDSPLKGFINSDRYTVSDDELLKRLCGLKD